ncbi:cupin domain-containing protein [Microbacterium sp. CFBP9034]|uniref:cupin domain-containing protein n=1 Tax=Microbacterium sp. CFBP9034 TaxID=3096540 RepID=UPI002A6A452B|nr:cupin domain-containing protein [Microbacterium sp. CFBP9034]MDY0910262.1 cupin domain-containing protein [Microbacterium sp. CFBP9034]
MTRLAPGAVTDAAHLPAPFEPVPSDQVIAGSPATRYIDLDEASGRSVGVWEMTPGAMRDAEADEVFVVLAGEATVEFADPALPAIELRPGSIVRLEEGMRTVWTVRETLRKVYIAP